MDDTALLAEGLNFLGVDFALIGYITFVAEDDESDVGNCVFFNLIGPGGTSFSQ